jgi:hypothetical protein
VSNVISIDAQLQERAKLVELANAILNKSVIEGIQMAQLYFPDSKLGWSKESNKERQILLVDNYKITFEKQTFTISKA